MDKLAPQGTLQSITKSTPGAVAVNRVQSSQQHLKLQKEQTQLKEPCIFMIVLQQMSG
ncbi:MULTISPECIES: hypothetical protein [unclassified Clostridium]|uniref:hypothetical protein n=1 Tax=unclassified Clostridium TaxID=2614128 RepID=UPI00209B01C5|nr:MULTISPECIES: hypothetical protein [unclassified Clostridium]